MAMNTSGEIDVHATPAAIIATIVDFATYPEWSSAHKKAVVEETDAQGRPSRVRMTMSMVGISDEQVVDYTFASVTSRSSTTPLMATSGSVGLWWRAPNNAARRAPTS